ncbi:LamG domain-containing protein, partial [Patescibacteria group bacterium]|nr:LamG domain-containing protein [Patescibacteria group bacterium]
SLDFDGVDDYVDASKTTFSTLSTYTLSAYVKSSAAPGVAQRILTLTDYNDSDEDANPQFFIRVDALYKASVFGRGTLENISKTSVSTVNDGKWHNIVGIINGSTGTVYLYLDGVYEGTATYGSAFTSDTMPTTYMGIYRNISLPTTYIQPFNGLIDEVRISNTARTAGWITTEYNNQSSVGSFMAIGAEVCMPVPATRSGGGENVKTRIKGGVRFRGGSRF